MKKIDEERVWGAALGVVGDDLNRPLIVIEGVLRDILSDMKEYRDELRGKGIEEEDDALYRRYMKLSCDLGALYNILSGGNALLSGAICDMLDGFVTNKNCN